MLAHGGVERSLLIVDDEPCLLKIMAAYFAGRPYHIDCAESFEHAVALLAGGEYGVVITDLSLSSPESVEGLWIAEYVREHCPTTRVVLLTADASSDVEREGRAAGVAAVLVKPTPLCQVASHVSRLLG